MTTVHNILVGAELHYPLGHSTAGALVLAAAQANAYLIEDASGNDYFRMNTSSREITIGNSSAAGETTLDINGDFVRITQKAQSSGAPFALTVSCGAHTTLGAGTEAPDVLVSMNRTVEWATGALATQRAMLVRNPTYAFVGASTLTTAATLAIEAAPTAGTNATITNAYAFWVQAGISAFGGNLNMTGSSPTVQVTTADSALILQGNRTAGSGSADFQLQSTATRTAGALAIVRNNTNTRFTVAYHGGVTVDQGAATTGTEELLVLVGAAHTGQTASAELNDVYFDLSRTVTFATGAITTQRAFLVDAPTYAFAGSSTITTACTAEVSGRPVAGANATITSSHCLRLTASDALTAPMLVLTQSSTGDAAIGFNTDEPWAIGVDNSDSDAFVIADSSALGTANRIRILPGAGEIQILDGILTHAAESGTDATVYRDGDTVTTTNSAAATTLLDIPAPISTGSGFAQVWVWAQDNDSTDQLVRRHDVAWRVASGTVTIVNDTAAYSNVAAGLGASTSAIVASAGNIRVQVTGTADDTINWVCYIWYGAVRQA